MSSSNKYITLKIVDKTSKKIIVIDIFSGKIIQTPLHMPGYGIWMFLFNFITQNNYGVIIGESVIIFNSNFRLIQPKVVNFCH